MTPLIGLTVFGYLFLIAICLTVWAALTLRDGHRARRRDELADGEPLPVTQRLGERPVWRAEERGAVAGQAERDRAPRRARERVESVPLRSGLPTGLPTGLPPGLPEVTPRDPVEGTGRVRVVPSHEPETRREPGRTITAKKLAVSETPSSEAAPGVTERRVSNDDVRGAKVVVKQRSLDDAFDRFLEVDRKDRGF